VRKVLLAVGLILGALPASAQSLDKPMFDRVLAEAKTYAADYTLLFFCLRRNPELAPFRYSILYKDIEAALRRLRVNGSDDQQNALFIETVLARTRVAPLDARDAALDEQCQSSGIVTNFHEFRENGTALQLRLLFLPIKP
jgi:hypothetical protein